MQDRTAIALSGGIDSLVAAALLKSQGHHLIGLHFISGYETIPGNDDGTANSRSDFKAIKEQAQEAMDKLSAQLDIPIYIIDLREEFKRLVVDYFVATYDHGKTPNPCVICNPLIKFNILFNQAQAYGATRIASGHYAQVEKGRDGRFRLLQGVDRQKDQSYFLARLSQAQLATIELPLGRMTKSETRTLAAQKGLTPTTRQESQDVCFIKEKSYGDFLVRQPGFHSKDGSIEDTNGKIVGRHTGLHQFTIGQRRGINCPAAEPYYVIRIDPDRNCLVVGTKDELLRTRCRVTDINWIVGPPGDIIEASTRIRYRHRPVAVTIMPRGRSSADITFLSPEPAVTPGQAAVFYRGHEVLGGGWIE